MITIKEFAIIVNEYANYSPVGLPGRGAKSVVDIR